MRILDLIFFRILWSDIVSSGLKFVLTEKLPLISGVYKESNFCLLQRRIEYLSQSV